MLKRVIVFVVSSLVLAPAALARDDIGSYSVADAMSVESVKEALDFGTDVRFYFGSQGHGAIQKNFGSFGTNKKTSAFGKSDEEACRWAFASAMKTLKERAIREGGNAVVNIKSNYRNNITESNDTYECGAGNVIAGVALVGTVVQL